MPNNFEWTINVLVKRLKLGIAQRGTFLCGLVQYRYTPSKPYRQAVNSKQYSNNRIVRPIHQQQKILTMSRRESAIYIIIYYHTA